MKKVNVRTAEKTAKEIGNSPSTNAKFGASGDTTDLQKLGKEFERIVKVNLNDPQSEEAQSCGLPSLDSNQHIDLFGKEKD